MGLTNGETCDIINSVKFAGVAELADALASGASVRKDVWVQVPPSALQKTQYSEESRSVVFFYLCRVQT